MSVMLYSHPGPHKIHGNDFEYTIVDEQEVSGALKKGWSKTTKEALAKATKPKRNPKAQE